MATNLIDIAPGLHFSKLVYGMWRLADADDTSPSAIQSTLETCLSNGISTIDQADIYGGYQAEALLGAALKAAPGLRDQIQLVTKCGIIAPVGRHAAARVKHYDTGRAHIMASVDQSLGLMATDFIDLLLIHRPDPFMDAAETGRALDDLVASGKVRAVGVSNFKPHDLDLLQSAMTTKLVTNQIELSLLHRAPLTDGDLAYLQRKQMPVMAWSPLGGGRLFDGSNAGLISRLEALASGHGVGTGAIALAWLLAHPAHILPLIGSNRRDRIEQLAKAYDIKIDRQTWFELLTIAQGHDVA